MMEILNSELGNKLACVEIVDIKLNGEPQKISSIEEK